MDAAPPEWGPDGPPWPHPDYSRFVDAAGVRWHVQIAGAGPPVLLLHGAGASSHSWREAFHLLAPMFRVIAPDLPGQGRSSDGPTSVYSIRGMARATAAMLRRLGVQPLLAVGHSAGAAICARMIIEKHMAPRALVGVNAALLPFGGGLASVYSGLARLLAKNPIAPRMFAWRAGWPGAVERLIEETGSRLSDEGIAHYRRLATDPAHVAATLRMMANWDLHELESDLPRLDAPLYLLVGDRDRTVPPDRAASVARVVPGAEVIELTGLGHLAHEEAPRLITDHIIAIARRHGVLPQETQ